MADREVSINIKETGAAAAAANVRKVAEAQNELAAATKKVSDISSTVNPMTDGSQLRATATSAEEAAIALHGTATEVERLAAEGEEAVRALEELAQAELHVADEGAKAAESSEKISKHVAQIATAQKLQAVAQLGETLQQVGAGLTNASADLEKFNPKLGTTAAVAGQASSQLGSFAAAGALGFVAGGPIGALVGVILAGLGDITKRLIGLKVDAAEAAKNAAQEIQRVADAAIAARRELGAREFEEWATTLDDGTEAAERQNDALERNVRLIQAKRNAELEVSNAQSALKMAQIDASDAPESEKIKQRAAVQRQIDRDRAQGKLNDLSATVASANGSVRESSQREVGARSIVDMIRREIEQNTGELADIRDRGRRSPLSEKDSARKDELLGALSQRRTVLADAEAKAEKAKADLEKSKLDRDTTVAIAREKAKATISAYQLGDQTSGIKAETASQRAAKSEKDKADAAVRREAERVQREAEAEQRRKDSAAGRLDTAGNSAADLATRAAQTKGIPRAAKAAFEKVSAQLENDPKGTDFAQLVSLLERYGDALEKSDATKAASIRQLERRAERLEQAVNRSKGN